VINLTSLVLLYAGVTAAQTPPTDATVPPADWQTPTASGIRGAKFMAEFDLYGTSGAVAATIRPYFWDGATGRWVKSVTTISVANSASASAPASREAHSIESIAPYDAIAFVVESITGAGATVSCRAAAVG
jgi:hypothetical protein